MSTRSDRPVSVLSKSTESIRQALNNAIDKVQTLNGWKRYGLCVLAGIFATLGMAPYYLIILLIIGYSILFTLLCSPSLKTQTKPFKSAFFTGWAFGFGYFLTGIYWMGFAFLTRGEQFVWLLPFAIPAFAAFLGLFFAVPAGLFVKLVVELKSRWNTDIHNWQHALLLASLISFFEYLRGHILTGLPWNLTGQALVGWVSGAQTVVFYGTYGLGLIMLCLVMLPVAFFRDTRSSAKGLLICLAGFITLFGIGGVILSANPTRYHDDITVSIIQPNIPQKDKANPALVAQNFEKLLTTSQRSHGGINHPTPADYMIWPENAVAWIDEQPVIMDILQNRIAPKTTIITGSIRQETGSFEEEAFFNTLATIEMRNDRREITRFYDKHHLVPFGEYLPLKSVLKAIGLAGIVSVGEGFTPGSGPQTFAIGPAPFSPLICYETIFSNEIYPRKTRPQWLVTVTNDAWFGDNAGPKQHLDQAKLRAIEFGLPMARSANTGISALIDANGRIIQKVPLYKDGSINHSLPLAKSSTFYARYGDITYFIMLLLAFTACFPVLKVFSNRS